LVSRSWTSSGDRRFSRSAARPCTSRGASPLVVGLGTDFRFWTLLSRVSSCFCASCFPPHELPVFGSRSVLVAHFLRSRPWLFFFGFTLEAGSPSLSPDLAFVQGVIGLWFLSLLVEFIVLAAQMSPSDFLYFFLGQECFSREFVSNYVWIVTGESRYCS
jgi:hypothetical protein